MHEDERFKWQEYERYKAELQAMNLDSQTYARLCREKAEELHL